MGFISPPPHKYLCFLSKKQEAACDFSNMLRTKSEVLNCFPCFGSAFHCQIHNYLLQNYSEAILPVQNSVLVACNTPNHSTSPSKEKNIQCYIRGETGKWQLKANSFIDKEKKLYQCTSKSHN